MTMDADRVNEAPASLVLRVLRGVSGSVTVGLVVLAAVVVGAAVFAGSRPGPGFWTVVGHVAVAVGAVVLQVFADRRRGPLAGLAAIAVLPLATTALWFWWWS